MAGTLNDVDEYQAAVTSATDAAAAYYDSDTELMSDAEYDTLLREIETFEAINPDSAVPHQLFTAVAGGTSEGGDVTHTYPMLSLDKANTYAEIKTFLAKVGDVIVEPKMDGLPVSITYVDRRLVRAVTRGDGRTGEDVTERLINIRISNLPATIESGAGLNVRGELVMSDEDFKVSNAARVAAGKPPFKNARNAAAGTLRRRTVDYDAQLTFIAFDGISNEPISNLDFHSDMMDWLTRQGFTTAASLIPTFDSRYATVDRVRDFGDWRKTDAFPYPSDGCVIAVDSLAERATLGATSRAPRWAIAYKYEAETATTKVLSIDVGVGRTGNISFAANLEPVFVDGSTVSRATLHNPAFIATKDIRIGSIVEIAKMNDIIPGVLGVVSQAPGSEPYVPSTVSPSGAPLDMSGAIWRSLDPADSIGAWIRYAASRDALDIEGIGTEVADALAESEIVNDIGDLFTLQFQQWANLRMADTAKGGTHFLGAKNATKIMAELEKAKSQPLNRVITALGIRKSGRTFGRRLAAQFGTMDAIINSPLESFYAVEGIGDERASLFYDGFRRLLPVIEKLRKAGVNMGAELGAAGQDAVPGAPLAGMKVVVTGAMSGPLAGLSRNEMNELIEANGGKSSGSVSASTSLLVCGEAGSSKWQKATDLGVRIVTPEEFAAMVGR